MLIAELVVAIAMLLVSVWGLRSVSRDYGRAGFAPHSSQRYALGLLLLLTASSAIQLWQHPESMSHWFLLGFNAVAVLAALVAARRRRRQASGSPASQGRAA